MNLSPGDKVKVVWPTKDATAAAWECVTIERIVKLSETEWIGFCDRFPFCAFSLDPKRTTKIE